MKKVALGLSAASAFLMSAVLVHAALADDLGKATGTSVQASPDGTTVVSLVGEAPKAERRSRARKAKPKDRFLFAVVRFDGFLARGFGVKQTLHTGTGSYRVFFNRDVTDCSFVASVSSTGTDDVHGVADAAHVAGKPRGLYVNTYSIQVDTGTGTLKLFDAPFHLQVMCAPE
jgi:hypothetical protein